MNFETGKNKSGQVKQIQFLFYTIHEYMHKFSLKSLQPWGNVLGYRKYRAIANESWAPGTKSNFKKSDFKNIIYYERTCIIPAVPTPQLHLFTQLSRLPCGPHVGQPDSLQILHHIQRLSFWLKFNQWAWDWHIGISVWWVARELAWFLTAASAHRKTLAPKGDWMPSDCCNLAGGGSLSILWDIPEVRFLLWFEGYTKLWLSWGGGRSWLLHSRTSESEVLSFLGAQPSHCEDGAADGVTGGRCREIWV